MRQNLFLIFLLFISLLTIQCNKKPQINVYSLVTDDYFLKLISDFEKNNNVSVNLIVDSTGTSNTFVDNILAEDSSLIADIIVGLNPLQVSKLKSANFLRQLPANLRDSICPPAFVDKDNYWHSFIRVPKVIIYNTNLLYPRNDAPHSIFYMSHNVYRENFAIANPLTSDNDFLFATINSYLKKSEVKSYIHSLAYNRANIAKTDVQVRKMVESGKVALGLVDVYNALQSVAANSNIDIIFPDQNDMGTIVIPSTIVLHKNAKPEIASKLIEYLTSAKVNKELCSKFGFYSCEKEAQYPEKLKVPENLLILSHNYDSIYTHFDSIAYSFKEFVE